VNGTPTPTPGLDWNAIAGELEAEGHAVLEGLLAPAHRQALIAAIDDRHRDGPDIARASWSLRRTVATPGRGEPFAFDPEPPDFLRIWRADFHRHLAPLATRWRQLLRPADTDRPAAGPAIPARPHDASARLDRLRAGDAIGLHRHADDADDADAPAFRLVLLLSEPGSDFTGGELVCVEQRPRMQSRPAVVPLRSGDAALICTTRPIRGARGPYPGRLRQAISRVHGGTRIGLALSLDGAP
jgi:hypothetical protein